MSRPMSRKSYSNRSETNDPAGDLTSNPSLVSSEMSFLSLQNLCRNLRETSSLLSACPSLYQRDLDSSFHTCFSDAGRAGSCSPSPSIYQHQLPNFHQAPFYPEPSSSQDKGEWHNETQFGDDQDDLSCAEWFNHEMMGFDVDTNNPHSRFDWPVPMEPVLSPSLLGMVKFGKEYFHVDEEGFVPVYTHGICRHFLVDKGSIGVWFGPDHPKNISERVHSGRKSAEAALFRAVIEAIRAAGNAGVKKLQINTDYINIVRFMLYFIWKWENNKWKTVEGTSVKNRTLIEELDYHSKLLEIKWNYVPAEDRAEGVLEAHRLAQAAIDDLKELEKSETNAGAKPEPLPSRKSRFNPY